MRNEQKLNVDVRFADVPALKYGVEAIEQILSKIDKDGSCVITEGQIYWELQDLGQIVFELIDALDKQA